MSRGWVLSDWYTVRTVRGRSVEAADEITNTLGYRVAFPPMTHGLDVLLVKFDIWEDEWWKLKHCRYVRDILSDGIVPWPVAIAHNRLAEIRAELHREQAGYLKIGKHGHPRSTEFMAYPHATLPLYSRICQTRNGTLLRRVARQVTQQPDTIS